MKILLLLAAFLVLLTEPFYSANTIDQDIPSPDAAALPTAIRQFAASGFMQKLKSKQPEHPLEPSSLIPEDALLVLDMTDAAAEGRAFSASRFGRTVLSTNWPAVLNRLGVKKRFRRPFEQKMTALLALLKNSLAQKIFSGRTVIALLPPVRPLSEKKIEQDLTKHLVLITRTDGHSEILLSLLKPEEKEMLYHRGIPVYALEPKKNKKIYTASVGGQLIFSPGLLPVQRSIDLFTNYFWNKHDGILVNSKYRELKKYRRSEDDLFLYADLTGLKSLFSSPAEAKGTDTAADTTESGPRPTGAESFGFFHYRAKNGHKMKGIVRFAPDQLFPLQKRVYTVKPIENKQIGSLPAGQPVYFWTNWLEPEVWRQTVLKRIKEDDEVASAGRISAWFRKQTGMKIKEFTSLFGREFSFNIAEISTAGFFPVPKICFIIEVRDRHKVKQFLEKMIAGMPIRRKKAAKIQVVSLMAAKGMMQPSYAFQNGFLLLADSREQIVDILTNKEKRLIDNSIFQAVDTGMRQPSNLHLFARIEDVVDALKELASWAGTMIAVRDRKTGAKSKILVDRVISPLLDGLKIYKAVGGHSYTRPGELIIEAALLPAAKNEKAANSQAKK